MQPNGFLAFCGTNVRTTTNALAGHSFLFMLNKVLEEQERVVPFALGEVQPFFVEKLSQISQAVPIKTMLSMCPAALLPLKAKTVNEIDHMRFKPSAFE